MYQKGDIWVFDHIVHLLGGWIRRHDDNGHGGELGRRQIGIVHEGHVWLIICTGGQVKLFRTETVSYMAIKGAEDHHQ